MPGDVTCTQMWLRAVIQPLRSLLRAVQVEAGRQIGPLGRCGTWTGWSCGKLAETGTGHPSWLRYTCTL